jgi:lipopolysaccharide/colanic/teichoic acid biosynthesis glycosyltransferase
MLRTAERVEPLEIGAALPERIGQSGSVLLASDGVAALVSIVLLAIVGGAASAFLALAVTFATAVAVGRYRVSYALRPADEWYQAAAVALIGAVFGIGLALIFELPWWGAPAGAMLWVAGAGACAALLQRHRRGATHYEAATDRLHHPRHRRSTAFELSLIRCCDAIFASAALVLGAPLFAAVALGVWLDDGAPIFFRQRRVGRDDNDFVLVKFRTMRKDAGEAWVRPGDTRLTKRGAFLRRTSLDELPQLWNVAVGQMSLVGPRPEMRGYAERFIKENPLYSLRHLLRPGLSGWAQLHLPRNLEPSDMPRVLSFDLFYAEHVCLYLYLYCLIKTACEFGAHRAV